MLRAVLFDLDNTLYSYDAAHAAAFGAARVSIRGVLTAPV